jgi:hypothetical protein
MDFIDSSAFARRRLAVRVKGSGAAVVATIAVIALPIVRRLPAAGTALAKTKTKTA